MFFERAEGGDRALLVHVDFPAEADQEDVDEFADLVRSAGAEPLELITARRQVPHPRSFVGSGKAEELRQAATSLAADVVLFNHALTPSQERNLEQILGCRVLDRTGLILDIFAQRARTHEGKLQVELAQLQHQATRLVRGWTHLERQKGGIGLRGPGETQLETDRRLLRDRIAYIQRRLVKVEKQRDQGRRYRQRSDTPTVALVGYTNAGKSTLFNALTHSTVYAADQLFATLDPTLRQVFIEDLGQVVLADTVGFIRHLPHHLVKAFKATLQETAEADLLLNVVDCAAPERDSHIEQVNAVLADLGIADKPQLLVYNKADLLGRAPRIDHDAEGRPSAVWLSASNQTGMPELRQGIAGLLREHLIVDTLRVPPEQSALRAKLHGLGAVIEESFDDSGVANLDVRIEARKLRQLLSRCGIQESDYIQPPETAAW